MFDPLPVHPVANLFPMLAEDELQELAEDIEHRGLLHPIVLDASGRVLDGRNRFAACEMVGVIPNYEAYEGDDPAGYVLATNVNRRHLSKGQRAMIAAQVLLVSSSTQTAAASSAGVSQQRVGQAVVVRDNAPDLIDAVAAGTASLDEAYKTARDRKAAAESAEAQLAKLRAEAPDLATAVTEERMSLAEALSAARTRVEEAQRQRRVATALLCDLITSLAKTNGSDTADLYEPDLAGSPLTEQVITEAQDALAHVAIVLTKRGLL